MSAATLSPAKAPPRLWLRSLVVVGIASIGLIALDQATGPFVRISIGFVFPVALVAYHWGILPALGLGLVLGASRVWLVLLSPSPWLVGPELVNLGLNLLVFSAVAWVVRQWARARVARTTEPVSLPVCGGCGRVRAQSGRWLRFESFVTSVTSASFVHTICPECESAFSRTTLHRQLPPDPGV